MLTSQTERFNKDLVKNADFSLILMADCKGRVEGKLGHVVHIDVCLLLPI